MSTFTEKTEFVKKKAKRFFFKMIAALVLLGIVVLLFIYYANYSTGIRAGIVLKVSKRGAIFKTYEGQLDLMSFGAVKSQNQLSQTFEFSVYKSDSEIIRELERVALTGERVNLQYEEKYAVLPWRGSTEYFVVGIDAAKGAPAEPQKKGFLED